MTLTMTGALVDNYFNDTDAYLKAFVILIVWPFAYLMAFLP